MARDVEQRKLLYKIALAYYEDNLTQEQIARRFGLSRIKISRLLGEARTEGIVQITLIPPKDSNTDVERTLETRFGLSEAVVITPSSYDSDTITRELGPAAAEYLTRRIQGKEVLGLSWGTTLHAVVQALPARLWPDLRVVQIIGGLGKAQAEIHGTEIVRRVAQATGAKPAILSSPGIVKSKLVRDALLDDPQIRETLELAAKADVAIVGLGAPTSGSVVVQAGTILSKKEIKELRALGAVGDIALRFFDAHGRPVTHEINDRIIGLCLEEIKKIPCVIGVAGSLEKLDVIRGALRGKLVDVLITDDKTARCLLEPADSQRPSSKP
jgi:DNA-binding transcriptional regulator LsrR (DeoR family)